MTTIGCALWAVAFVLTGEMAAGAWTTINSIVRRALLVLGLGTLAITLMRRNES